MLLAEELLPRSSAVTVTWLKWHAKDVDVARGRTTREDKIGNDGADMLAVAGAAAHNVDREVVQVAAERRRIAIQTHKMMLSILLARQACENDASHEADRGSDAGYCTDLDGVDFACADEELEMTFEMSRSEVIDDEIDIGYHIPADVH